MQVVEKRHTPRRLPGRRRRHRVDGDRRLLTLELVDAPPQALPLFCGVLCSQVARKPPGQQLPRLSHQVWISAPCGQGGAVPIRSGWHAKRLAAGLIQRPAFIAQQRAQLAEDDTA